MTAPWLHIVGIGEDGIDGLSATARAIVGGAEVFLGGERHLAMLPTDDQRERIAWPSPLTAIIDRLKKLRGQKVCILASGDPFCFGIGTTLARTFDLAEMLVIPAPGAIALAASRLGWPHHAFDTLTLHGRPLSLMNAWLQPGRRLMLLSHGAKTPHEVAELLADAGFGASRMTVLEHLGGDAEKVTEFKAEEIADRTFADLNTIALELEAAAGAAWFPSVSGLPDHAFIHDGNMTKREVRAITVAALAPSAGQLLWDVGGGCGSVSVEWMRHDPRCQAIAIEEKAARRDLIANNATALGVPGLEIVGGSAPEALEGLEAPDAILIGGGLTRPGVFEDCWSALKPGGRLVANVVTLDGEWKLTELHNHYGGELRRIDVSRAAPLGGFRAWKPFAPVTQWEVVKPHGGSP